MESRYIVHSSDLDGVDIARMRRELEERLLPAVAAFQQESPPDALQIVDSMGRKKEDYTIYTGTPGNIALYERLQPLHPHLSSSLIQSIDAFLRVYRTIADHMDPPSYFCGTIGPLTHIAVQRKDVSLIATILNNSEKLDHPRAQDDLLYGTPGFMYCLVYILRKWADCPSRSELICRLNTAAQKFVRRATAGGILQFPFPARNGCEYVGAAHGSFGALQVLLLSREFLEADYTDVVKRTLDALLDLQLPSGNFPMTFLDRDEDFAVHFCHGATGAVSPLLSAHALFGDPRYLQAAINAGMAVWMRGLLRKGAGLCHGCCGNAYSFLSLYRHTLDVQWLNRAVLFAYKSLLDPECARAFAEYDDPQRLVRGSPDTPWSLMEGRAGALCLWADVLRPTESSFPGYEI